jgi:hypothetical protein
MSTPSSAMPAQFRRKKLLTRPTLKFVLGQPIYVKIEGPMFIGRDIKTRGPAAEGKKKEPATVLNVIDLTTGEEAQIVCATIVKSTLSEEYPNDAYVGKSFELTKMAKEEGKDYNKYRIVEIEDAEPAPVNKKEPRK